jgi:putative Mg2+ transporter-C (MgtC) family protein
MSELTVITRIVLAAILGSVVGYERERLGKEAGVRTHALVTMGSALFTMLSFGAFQSGSAIFDPSRIASQIVIGIGFLAGGILIHHEHRVQGLTTAAELWVAAALGMAVGVGWYAVAIFLTFFVFLILSLFRLSQRA